MKRQRTKATIVAVGIAAFVLAGCGESVLSGDSGESKTERQAVTVVPEFQLTGTEDLPEELRLNDLGLAVSEIDLTPVAGAEGLAYSNRDPVGIDFEVSGGQTVRKGRELVLPEAGQFDVSLRLEAVNSRASVRERLDEYSFRVSGYIAGDAVVRVDSTSDGENQDGDPIPFPAAPERTTADGEQVTDKPSLPKQWTPFEYKTDKSVVYTLDKVEFVNGKQVLSFKFDAREWALELLDPLARAVQSNSVRSGQVTSGSGSSVVDVTKEIDKRGEGPESFGDHVSVRTQRHSGGL